MVRASKRQRVMNRCRRVKEPMVISDEDPDGVQWVAVQPVSTSLSNAIVTISDVEDAITISDVEDDDASHGKGKGVTKGKGEGKHDPRHAVSRARLAELYTHLIPPLGGRDSMFRLDGDGYWCSPRLFHMGLLAGLEGSPPGPEE